MNERGKYVYDTRIVVTGMGAVTPFGEGVSLFWNQIISGQSAIK